VPALLSGKDSLERGKAFKTENGNAFQEKMSRIFAALVRNFDIPVGRPSLR
jgi:hypothetical protein